MRLSNGIILLILLLSYLILLPVTFFSDPLVITGGNDMANLIPAAMQVNDPALFSRDSFFQHFIELYPKPFLYGYAWLLDITGDFITVNYFVSSLCYLLFVFGVYFLVLEQFKDRRIALVCALLCIAVRPALAITFGMRLGLAIPRNVIIALSPWILLGGLRLVDRKHILSWSWGLLFFGIGLLANVHPLTAGHLALVALGVMMLTSTLTPRQKAIGCALGLATFGLGALPFIIDKFLFVSAGGIAPRSLILERAWFILPPYIRNLGNYGLFVLQILPFLVVGAAGYLLSTKRQQAFSRIGIATCAVVLLTALEYIWPKAVTFEFLRASVWLYLPLLAYSSVAIVRLWERDIIKKIGAVALLLVLGIPTLALSPLTDSAIGLYGSLSGYRPYEFTHGDWYSYQQEVLALGQWMKSSTPKDALFLIPPRGLEHLRMYGQRSFVVTHKDANIHEREYALRWEQTYETVEQAYRDGSLVDAASRYDADYVVVDATDKSLELPLVYENTRFLVYKV